jgi:hypothetical protein
MKLKIVAGLILLVFASFADGVKVNCVYSFDEWPTPIGNVYVCNSRSENTGNLTIIEDLQGIHLSGKNNADVEVFFENGGKLQNIPSNLADFFPNLKVLGFEAPLQKLTANDLKPFPNLIRFWTDYSQFTSIDDDLFQFTQKLQQIDLLNGKVLHVGKNLLNGLDELKVFSFTQSCLNFFYDSVSSFNTREVFKQVLLEKCPPLEKNATTTPGTTTTIPGTTTTTPGTSTTTLTNSQDNKEILQKIAELYLIVSKQETVIAQLLESIKKEEDRLEVLEKKTKEIGSDSVFDMHFKLKRIKV